mmetsp:Transcript_20044/g.29078  ORF Transcript_20044/g.29078 Transcript_20044/m.29078 type:complete len:88 (-) Transcript_20044:48-311(-)
MAAIDAGVGGNGNPGEDEGNDDGGGKEAPIFSNNKRGREDCVKSMRAKCVMHLWHSDVTPGVEVVVVLVEVAMSLVVCFMLLFIFFS